MSTHLRVLLIEDSDDDAALVVRALKRGGYRVEFERIDTSEALASAFERHGWDPRDC